MWLQLNIFLSFLFVVSTVLGGKSDVWPPKIVYDVFDVNTYVGNCLKLHNPDVAKLRELELSTNFDQLPDDRSIKCYLHCMMLESGLMQPNSTAINFARLIDAINLMEKPEQDIYLKMGRKCNKKNKDVCEMIYQLNVCVKQNDNEHYYIFYEQTPN